MSITDELREIAAKTECANGRCEKLYRGDLEHIADRIDAALAERYVELPKDADGVPIRVGDVMDNTHKRGFTAKVVIGISYHEGGTTCVRVDEDELRWHDPLKLRHHHEPTVEDVLTEFGIDWEHESDCEDRAALLKEYATKLQLKEDK